MNQVTGSDVVVVHGIGQHRTHRAVVTAEWREAMVTGLHDLADPHAAALGVEAAFYGQEYNDGKGDEPEYDRSDLEDGFETDLVLGMAAALKDEVDGGKQYAPGAVQRAFVTIQRSDWFDGLDARLLRWVKHVHRYFEDADLRGRVVAEMDRAMATGPRVLIAHSLGSVVAWEWLAHRAPDRRPALVTIGSPLGLEVIRRRLARPPGGSGWPAGARSWCNIAAHHDAVAAVKELAPLYDPRIDDKPCDNPRRGAHAMTEYLANVRVARALATGLG